jgi:hypothetical protein
VADRPIVHPRFRKVFGDAFADFIEEVAAARTKSKIDSVGRTTAELQDRKPNPPKDLSDQWWNK